MWPTRVAEIRTLLFLRIGCDCESDSIIMLWLWVITCGRNNVLTCVWLSINRYLNVHDSQPSVHVVTGLRSGPLAPGKVTSDIRYTVYKFLKTLSSSVFRSWTAVLSQFAGRFIEFSVAFLLQAACTFTTDELWYGTRSQGISLFYLHTRVHPLTEWTADPAP